MNANLAAVLYLVAGVLFILSLRGLSSPASSRQGNLFGMIGMAIAVATTLASHPPADGVAWVLVMLGIAIGGCYRRCDRAPGADDLDAGTGRRLPLAGRHGRGAGRRRRVLCARKPSTSARPATSIRSSLVEMSLGVAIGALTFTGSVIAFLKLSARMSGAPIILPFRHIINIALARRAGVLHRRPGPGPAARSTSG